MSDALSVLAYGDRALLVELGEAQRVLRYVDALRDADLDCIADLVPAAETVLVIATERASVETLRDRLREVSPDPDPDPPTVSAPRDEEDAIEVPVRYDGPDLGDVARHTGLSEDEVVAAHTGQTWRVGFGGFAPGFGYLLGDDRRLEVPRRDSARTSVPAGAVGLAGEYTGVYPRESPGGWQLIGTTDAVMWDLQRDPPALLRPGAAVRFVRVDR